MNNCPSSSVYKIIIFLLLIINITSKKHIREDYTDEGYETLLKWGFNNSLDLNDKIKLTSYKLEKQYLSQSNISKGETIMDIPPEIMLSIDQALSILNSTTLKTQYKNYITEDSKSNQTLNDISHIQQSFLSYILYNINGTKTQGKETKKFYEHYKPLYYLFEDNIDHLPSFFSEDQINTFLNSTSFGSFFELMNSYLMGEVNLFEKKIFKEEINLEEYFRYRFLVVQKSYNISNMTTIAPFVDFIKRDFINPNSKISIVNGHLKIKAVRDIAKSELITIKPHKINNKYSFFFYGKLYEELNDYMPSFFIPFITPNLFNEEGLSLDIDDLQDYLVDLAWPNIYEIILPMYKQVAQTLKKDDSDYSCYGYFLKYLNMIKKNYDKVHYDEIEDEFNDEYDSNNVIRIFEFEKRFLRKKIKELNNLMEKMNKKVKIM